MSSGQVHFEFNVIKQTYKMKDQYNDMLNIKDANRTMYTNMNNTNLGFGLENLGE
eukprot:CAMPEP_0116916940 /NCGR_PEP_ID=MMETSP0467-20121206/18836_1 /TAXON_ID=283647 /ORGANISM="Mesodinium pulex, Strain SPMC105" /LENGTH=54 /DNA_ID=CAMNT_0004593917 /DNA_START=716 /DNA_END=880 /DNA_ORIENTATION=+